MKCSKCGYIEKNENSTFCSHCGATLKTNSNSSNEGSKKLFLGIGIGFLVTCLLVASFVFGFHSNNASQKAQQSDKISQTSLSEASTSVSFKASQEEKISSQTNPYKADDLNHIQLFESKPNDAPSSTSAIFWNTVQEALLAPNYSGPACAVMALSLQDIFVSQSALAAELGLTTGNQVADYRNLTNVMNQYLANSGSNMAYFSYYVDPSNLSSLEEKKGALAMLLNQVDFALQSEKIPLVVVGQSPDGILKENSYATVVGRGEDQKSYWIEIPYLEGARKYLVDYQTLANLIFKAGFLCYLV